MLLQRLYLALEVVVSPLLRIFVTGTTGNWWRTLGTTGTRRWILRLQLQGFLPLLIALLIVLCSAGGSLLLPALRPTGQPELGISVSRLRPSFLASPSPSRGGSLSLSRTPSLSSSERRGSLLPLRSVVPRISRGSLAGPSIHWSFTTLFPRWQRPKSSASVLELFSLDPIRSHNDRRSPVPTGWAAHMARARLADPALRIGFYGMHPCPIPAWGYHGGGPCRISFGGRASQPLRRSLGRVPGPVYVCHRPCRNRGSYGGGGGNAPVRDPLAPGPVFAQSLPTGFHAFDPVTEGDLPGFHPEDNQLVPYSPSLLTAALNWVSSETGERLAFYSAASEAVPPQEEQTPPPRRQQPKPKRVTTASLADQLAKVVDMLPAISSQLQELQMRQDAVELRLEPAQASATVPALPTAPKAMHQQPFPAAAASSFQNHALGAVAKSLGPPPALRLETGRKQIRRFLRSSPRAQSCGSWRISLGP